MFFNLDFAYNNEVTISKILHLPSMLANRRLFSDLDDALGDLLYATDQRIKCKKLNKLVKIDEDFHSNGIEEVVDAIINDGSFNNSLIVELRYPAPIGSYILYTVIDTEEELKQFVERIVKEI